MKKAIYSVVFSFLTMAAFAQEHGHTDNSHKYDGYTDTTHAIILEQLLKSKGLENKGVQIMIVDLPPKSKSIAHIHPCETFGYVIEGEIESVFEGKTYHYKAGEAFYELPNGKHTATLNNDAVKPAKLVVFYIHDKGKPTFLPIK